MDFSLVLLGITITTFSGFIGQLAGGGGGMITIPLLIFLGIPPHTAIGSNKTAAFGNIGALYKYTKAKKVHWNWTPLLITISIVAAWFGATLVLNTDPALVKRIISVLLLSILPFVLLKKTWGTIQHSTSQRKKGVGLLFYSLAAVIQAAFSAGLGIINTYILVNFFGWTLIEANATRRLPLIIMNILVFGIFFFAGVVNLSLALGIFLGQFVGGYFGAHMALKKGNDFVKIFFTIFIVASAVKLFL